MSEKREPFQPHPNLSKQVNDAIAESELLGGAYLKDLPTGKGLIIRTKNTTYLLRKGEDGGLTLQGHPKYCPIPTPVHIAGSTWGGSMIKLGFVGRGMHLEFYPSEGKYLNRCIVTSPIEDIWEVE